MQDLIIFSAKYLIYLSPVLTALFVWRLPIERRRAVFMLLLCALPLTYVLGVGARALYENPRPFVVGKFAPLVEHEADNGFPSDHMLLASALAACISFCSKRWALILWIIAAAVGSSRILAGVHHPMDIAGSIVLALVAAWSAHFFLQRRRGDIIN